MNSNPTPKISPLGPKKVRNDPKIKLSSKFTIEENIENKSFSNTLVDPKTVFELYPNPKNTPLEPQKVKNDPKKVPFWLPKVKNDPKIKSKSKAWIEENMEN